MSRLAWLGLGALSVLWGAAYLVIALALQGFPPVVVVLGRVCLALFFLLPFALRRGVLPPLLQHPWWVLLTVLVQSTAPLLLLTFGQERLSSSITGILIGAQPLFVAVLAIRFDPPERPQGVRGVLGLLLGIVGLVLLFGLDLSGRHALLGGSLVVGAALCYAIGALLIHKKLTFAEPLGIATAAMMVSTVALLIPGLLSLPTKLPTMKATVALVALGIVFTGVTLTLFYGLIARAGPARAALAFYLSPGVTVILSWLIFAEHITWITVTGLVAIVLGSILAANRVRVEG